MPETLVSLPLFSSHIINPSFSGLVEWGAELAGVSLESTEHLAGKILASPRIGQSRSTLNNDGSPLQLCVTLGGQGCAPAIRLIADPAAEEADGLKRWLAADEARSALVESHATALKPLCDSLVDGMLPNELSARAALPNGAMWLAADLSGQGMAVYTTTKWEAGLQRWQRAQEWLETILPDASVAVEKLKRLAPRAHLISAGIEGSHPQNARAKLYWRLQENASLRDLEIPLFENDVFSEFLFEAVGKTRQIPRAAIVGSIGFHVATGSLKDAKLDVCGHCVRRTPEDWTNVIERIVVRQQLARSPKFLETAELAFTGCGLDTELRPRLNLYLKNL